MRVDPIPRRLLLFATAALSLSRSRASEPRRSLRMGWTVFPPFLQRDARTGEAGGLDVELIRAALADCGVDLSLEDLPPARQLKELEAGRVDLLPAWPERPTHAFARHSAAYRLARNVLYLRAGEAAQYPMREPADLLRWPELTLAITRGTAPPGLEALMAEAAFRRRLVETTGIESSIRMLMAGHVRGVLCGEIAGLRSLQQMGLQGRIEAHPMPTYVGRAHVLFSAARVDEATRRCFDAAMRSMQTDGRYRRLLKAYGLQALPIDPDRRGAAGRR